MQKFTCDCGRKVRDVYYKNGAYMCNRCFWQDSDSPFDYLINMLASKGLVVTFHGEPVLVLKQFSADFLDEKEKTVTPDAAWITVAGDDFWMNYTGQVANLRSYITEYGSKKEQGCQRKED